VSSPIWRQTRTSKPGRHLLHRAMRPVIEARWIHIAEESELAKGSVRTDGGASSAGAGLPPADEKAGCGVEIGMPQRFRMIPLCRAVVESLPPKMFANCSRS